MIGPSRVQLQAYVLKETKAAAAKVAAAQGISTSAWVQLVVANAVEEYQAKQARKAAAVMYDGSALL